MNTYTCTSRSQNILHFLQKHLESPEVPHFALYNLLKDSLTVTCGRTFNGCHPLHKDENKPLGDLYGKLLITSSKVGECESL